MDIGKLFLIIGANTSELDAKLRQSSQRISSLGQTFLMAGAAISAAVGIMIKKTVDFGHDVYEMSQKTGVSTEMLGGFKLAAETSGASLELFAIGMRKLSQTMVGAEQAGDMGKKALNALHIEVRTATGGFRPLAEIVMDVADKFSKMEDGAVKNKIAVELFGRSGLNLIPMLNQGSAALRENYTEAERLGLVMSNETARAFDEAKDAQVKSKLALQGLGLTITQSILPIVKGLADLVTDLTVGFKNFAKVHPGLSSAVTTLAIGFGAVLTVTGGLLVMISKLQLAFTALGSSAIVLGGSIAILTAGVGVLVLGYLKMKEATRKVIEQQDEMIKQESWMIEMMSLAAAKVGIHGEEYEKLIKKYKNNTLAMWEGIVAGRDTEELQISLRKVTAEYRYELERKKMKAEEVAKAEEAAMIAALLGGDKTKKMLEEVRKAYEDLMTRGLTPAQKETRYIIKNMVTLDDAFKKGLLPADEYRAGMQRLQQQLWALNDQAIPLTETLFYQGQTARDMSFVFGVAMKGMDRAIADFTGKLGNSVAEFANWVFGIQSAILGFAGIRIPFPHFGTAEDMDAEKKRAEELKSTWEGIANSISQSWITTFQTMMDKAVTFGNFFKAVWESIKDTFKVILSQMLAQFAAMVFKEIALEQLAAAAAAVASVFKTIPFPFSLIAAIAAIGAVAALFASLHLDEGGVITQTGSAIVHKGEMFIPPAKANPLPSLAAGGQRVFKFYNDVYVGGKKFDGTIVEIVEEADALGNLRLKKALR